MTHATIDPWVRQLLRCPVTGAELVDAVGPDGEPELVSTSEIHTLAYPVRDGVPILLEAEARAVSPLTDQAD
ncbi:Trm112 family protein [Georgenia muralis]|uniref:Uncharacterized protein n=1 Tax=Georgenia muralis TaxID=154117 RepID=A0A3N4Z2M5_9MICO|nr:hypothetical protein [Georgenia muralis]RPF25886.1 hypothetical protein EDD32_0300 [Georgenia muralis]